MGYQKTMVVELSGDAASDVDSNPIYVGGRRVTIQASGPAANNSVLVGSDRVGGGPANWSAAVQNDVGGTAITSVDSGVYQLRDRVPYILLRVESGGAAGALHRFVITVDDDN